MRTHSPRVATGRPLSSEEFELLLRRAAQLQKLYALQSVPKPSRVRKSAASAA